MRPMHETEDLLLSNTEKCETLIKQTHTRPHETLQFKLTKSKETFSFETLISVEGSWMIGLTSLEVCNSVFISMVENNKFKLYTDTFDELSFGELKNELEEIFRTSDITIFHQQHEQIVPRVIKAYSKLKLEKSSIDDSVGLLKGYARSPIRDFESYFKILDGLDEYDILLNLKEYVSLFFTYDL